MHILNILSGVPADVTWKWWAMRGQIKFAQFGKLEFNHHSVYVSQLINWHVSSNQGFIINDTSSSTHATARASNFNINEYSI
jgi:hypothetical protein